MLNRSLLVVTAVGAIAIITVALAAFGAPSLNDFNQYYSGQAAVPAGMCPAWPTCLNANIPEGCTFAALIVPDCPSGHEPQLVPGSTDVYPPRYVYECVPVLAPKTRSLPTSPGPVAVELPASGDTVASPFWSTRLRYNIASFWQRLF
jgi:hypothetical protein